MDCVALFNVADFVADDGRQLIVTGHVIQKALVHIDKASGTGQCVYILGVQYLERVLQVLPAAVLDQVLADAVDPVLDLVVLVQAILGFQLFGHFLAHFYFRFFPDHSRLGPGHRQQHQAQ